MPTKKKPPGPPRNRSTLIPQVRGATTKAAAIVAGTTKKANSSPPAKAVARPAAARAPAADVITKGHEAVAEQLIELVLTLRNRIDKTFYEMGVALRELARRDVYGALQFKSFEALLKARGLPSKMQANKLITIVDAFDDESLPLGYGVEKAYEVARYLTLEHPNRSPAAVIAQNPLIQIGDTAVRLSAIKRADLTAFVRDRLATDDEPDDSKDRIEAVARRIGRVLRRLGVDPDRVRTILSRTRGHRLRIELTAEEAEDLLALIKSRGK